MAESFSHKWGQIIGNLVQEFICETLQVLANEHNLYLDYQKKRQARSSKKVSWQDRYGNFHDLDYVLERGGTEETRGLPAAFIETAWRRYTKHSRNKAQEIEGALIPLAETYSHLNPFLGVIVAGIFTQGSLDQLDSKGFKVLYLKYEKIVQAFAAISIDASFDEKTPEEEFKHKIAQWQNLSTDNIANIKNQLIQLEKNNIDNFIITIERSLARRIEGVSIIILHGQIQLINSIEKAIEYVQNYKDNQATSTPVLRYEVDIRYNNGDVIHAIFQSKLEAIACLRTFAS